MFTWKGQQSQTLLENRFFAHGRPVGVQDVRAADAGKRVVADSPSNHAAPRRLACQHLVGDNSCGQTSTTSMPALAQPIIRVADIIPPSGRRPARPLKLPKCSLMVRKSARTGWDASRPSGHSTPARRHTPPVLRRCCGQSGRECAVRPSTPVSPTLSCRNGYRSAPGTRWPLSIPHGDHGRAASGSKTSGSGDIAPLSRDLQVLADFLPCSGRWRNPPGRASVTDIGQPYSDLPNNPNEGTTFMLSAPVAIFLLSTV